MGSGVRAAFIRSVLGAAAFSLTFLVLVVAPGHAQSSPPLPGFVPPYEITRIVRSAGFDPLALPLREGTTYVIRAADLRGVLMRVVVDARSGAIRAVNRIVSDQGQGMYGTIGMVPPYGAPPPYAVPPLYGVSPPYALSPFYGGPSAYAPPEFEVPDIAPSEEASVPASTASVAVRPSVNPVIFEPPLPRPRPATLAARRTSDDARAAVKTSASPAITAAPAPEKPSPIELHD